MDSLALWQRYQKHLCVCPSVGLSLDISRIRFGDRYLAEMEPRIEHAYSEMERLESGVKVNPDELDDAGKKGRMVGHYWLRNSAVAPTPELQQTIETALADIRKFVKKVHKGTIAPPKSSGAAKFTDILVIGIGGSALGPQLVADCLGGLGGEADAMKVHFLDNTDPDGFDRIYAQLKKKLKSTLVLVISKSGGTAETRNGMLEVQAMFEERVLKFNRHAVAVTGVDSKLDKVAVENKWLARFPMWDWVGGRASVMSAVGLLPAALQGIDIDAFLAGAAAMDEITRSRETAKNPAALLALMWHHETEGKGAKDMVVLPYKDRLLLLSRYLQQLIMESLGKRMNLDESKEVFQGIAVYGNKGSTDQHAYVQQLRDGVQNFFATFIVAQCDSTQQKPETDIEVEPGVTSGDFLKGFWQGTRSALFDSGRGSITIVIDKLTVRTLGALIALYERAVGYYATLVDINAYHQPGVEAGKKAAASVLTIQNKVTKHMAADAAPATAESIADAIGEKANVETVFHILSHLAANSRGVKREGDLFAKG
ncbi:MAG: glucose-6-phosphate isomerase [Phycisphaeraceae bacterium]